MSSYYTLKSILIPLTKRQRTRISPCDADLARNKWVAHYCEAYSGKVKYNVMRHLKREKGKPRRAEYLHRVIMSRILGRGLEKGEYVDHINRNPLDNRRSNLRVATNAQNCMNKTKYSSNTSGYKGVTWNKSRKKWMAQIMTEGKNKFLGHYDTREEAYAAYCDAALEYHGEYARVK